MPDPSRLALAAAAGIGIILWAPLADRARAAIRTLADANFAAAVAAIVIGAILLALVAAVVRIRRRPATPAASRLAPAAPPDTSRPAVRYLLLALAVAIGVVYAQVTSTGSPDVDAVERFHFVEYGLLTWLCYRAWLPAGDRSTLIAPVLAALLVGTLDEWVQWLIPYRVGEARDVLLNGAAIACGMLFSVAVEPPSPSSGLRPGSRAWLSGLAAAAWMTFFLFFSSVQVGYEIESAAHGRFLSTLSRPALAAATQDRTERWRGMTAPMLAKRFSIEDRYLTEGLWHAQRRNALLGAGQLAPAWSEHRIVEEFYGALLDRPTTDSPGGHRLPPEQEAAARAAHAEAGTDGYVSTAHPFPLYPWPKWILHVLALGGSVVIAGIGIIRR